MNQEINSSSRNRLTSSSRNATLEAALKKINQVAERFTYCTHPKMVAALTEIRDRADAALIVDAGVTDPSAVKLPGVSHDNHARDIYRAALLRFVEAYKGGLGSVAVGQIVKSTEALLNSEPQKQPKSSAPGPFPLRMEVGRYPDQYVIVTNQGTHWATTYNPSAARLIVAGPGLLDALRGMLEWARRVKQLNRGPEIANACAAIHAAEVGL